MRRTPYRTWAMACGAIALIVAAFLYALNPKDSAIKSAMPLPELRTTCIGRFLIDLPVDMEFSGDVDFYYGLTKDFQTTKFEPLAFLSDQHKFRRLVEKRLGDLRAQREPDTPTHTHLAESKVIDDFSVLIVSYREPFPALKMEIIMQRGNSIGRISRKIYNNASQTDNPKEIESELISMAHRITAADDPLHAGKGTCFGNMLINDNHDGEVFTVFAGSKRYPDIGIELFIDSMLAKNDGGMLRRIDNEIGALKMIADTGTIVRRGKTIVAGKAAEEIVKTFKEKNKVVRHFDVETLLPTPARLNDPHIHLGMRMGGQVASGEYVDASLSESDSLRLWDDMLKSVRVRPGSF
ncbi:T6SS immunity protein Tli4 family protein [Pseudorhodoferax sp.]|uniref:T6SS immunity protein Tli4 family protein n=1 Tax=Pseudorhodoferax sp. TaxID=1993553 RepID=UPI0039E47CBA